MATTTEARAAAVDLAAEGRRLGDAAGPAIAAALTAQVVGPAARAVAAALADRKAEGAVAEVVADVAGLSAVLGPVLDRSAAWLADALLRDLAAALAAGWWAGVAEQDRLLPPAVRLAPEGRTEEGDRRAAAALAGWPIVGHPAPAVAEHHARTWRFQAGAIMGAAIARGDAAAVPGDLVVAAQQAGGRAGLAIAEAFQAGAGAARIAAGEALRRAIAG